MSYYTPTYIQKYETGLVQSRQNFIIPNDAYPILENAFIWRERLKRKSGYNLLGRLRRLLTAQDLMVSLDVNGDIVDFDIKAALSLEVNGDIEPGSVTIIGGTDTLTDDSLGVLTGVPNGTGTINYTTMVLNITGATSLGALTATFNYYPSLPTMGLRQEELNGINAERLIVFDTVYAYRFTNDFQEFIPGTVWTGTDSEFFWSTNYWVDRNNEKIFWVTNFSGITGDPIRYTQGSVWEDFAPQIDGAGNNLTQCLAMLPYRGRLVTFNTFEGPSLAASIPFPNRIRWAAIGNPFDTVTASITAVNANAWRDDIIGQGGFLDIPTSQSIISIGFVRDNVVIFCERSTWQLRYTGQSIAPFQIERVNTELGGESTFSAIQFDTSLVVVGDKGIVECDSFKSDRIDIKIPDLIFRFNNDADGVKRVHGVRDFQQRIVYWTYPEVGFSFPNKRLVYNYENDSWAIFTDSLTTLGTFQEQNGLRWVDFPDTDPDNIWQQQTYPWVNRNSAFPSIVGGNQQGFVERLGQYGFEYKASNDISLYIRNITGNTTTATSLEIPNHNLQSGQIIEVLGIPTGTAFATSLNGNKFSINVTNSANFTLNIYDVQTDSFIKPQLDAVATYIGGGKVAVRDNFRIQSKKFNYFDKGENIQFGFMDILCNETDTGAFTMEMFIDYNDTQAQNTLGQNVIGTTTDTFFNQVIPTSSQTFKGTSKNWQRIYCNTRGSSVTLEFKFSNSQMIGDEQEQDVQIDAQVLWMRPAGRELVTF